MKLLIFQLNIIFAKSPNIYLFFDILHFSHCGFIQRWKTTEILYTLEDFFSTFIPCLSGELGHGCS